jgi:glucosamine-phosphate N-acetyltransferase
MKILFVSSYINNSHFIKISKQTLDKNLINSQYDFICLNDAPDINKNEENYLQIVSMLSGNENCFQEIKNDVEYNNFIHIKIPQNIHIKNRQNHSSLRHVELLTYFFQNIENLFPNYINYDYITIIDSDVFIIDKIDFYEEFNHINYDIIAPFIYINNVKYPHVGFFMINIKTINLKNLDFSITISDTGLGLSKFISNNSNFKIKEIAKFNGYSHPVYNLESTYIKNINDNLIDTWFENKIIHLRAGSCFSIGSKIHRNLENVIKYKNKINKILNYYNLELFNIRLLEKNDYNKGFLELINEFTKNPIFISFENFCNYFDNISKYKYTFILENDNQIIGTGSCFIENKFHNNFKNVAHIEDIVINKKYRKIGYGKIIIDYILNYCNNLNCYKITLNCSNENITFYEKCGFIKKGIEMTKYLE